MKNRIYLDYAATSPMLPEVLEAMMPYLTGSFGNPSGVYATGREARKAVEQARRQAAEFLGAEPSEILFTSGGTESDNMAIRGAMLAAAEKGRHLITDAIEHHAVLHTCEALEKQGFEATYLQPDREGVIAPESVRKAIRADTVLISVMTVNNEIGTVEPVAEIGRIAREAGVLFHTDAVQAAGMMRLDVRQTGADLMSLSAHKFHGPKGIGCLYVRRGTRLDGILSGGAQERGLRPGTENVAAIVGMGAAMEIARRDMDAALARIRRLRDRLITRVLSDVPDSFLNGPEPDAAGEKRAANNAHFSFAGIDGEALLLRLDLAGIAASAGSACTAGSMEASHVLKAVGLDDGRIRSGIRLTLGRETTEEEIDQASAAIAAIVADLRRMHG